MVTAERLTGNALVAPGSSNRFGTPQMPPGK
jgi:hypothetical protein